ncbi:helix-turn-helix domain-containing protein [Pelagibacteraceae bacterium]|nr:helix-turn-helix domain-containing protein [Pelagibacteraceae bacterium]
MHNTNTKFKILCLTSIELSNSLRELKEHLDFNLIFSQVVSEDISLTKYEGMIIDADLLKNQTIIKSINSVPSTSKLLITNSNDLNKCSFDDKIERPISFKNLKNKIVKLVTVNKFNQNSSVDIKKYTLDKNEKKLKNKNNFVDITEKEIQLIELLFNKKEPIQKKEILKSVWGYSSDADTHTVETHIYRLRKKVLQKFKDDNFIVNDKTGYTI